MNPTTDSKYQLKAFAETVEGKLLAVASEEVADRDGDVIALDGWDLKNFKMNPVLMWLHMMDGNTMPIGKANKIGIKEVDGKRKLIFEPEFHDLTPEASTIKQMYEAGYLKAFSVGFQPKEWERISADGEFPPRYKYTKQELIEISAVPIPALPSAVIIDNAKKSGMDVTIVKGFLKEFENAKQKGALPYKETPTAPVDEPWDAAAEMMACDNDMMKLKAICAWFDSEKPDVKSSYKLPHHKADGEHPVVWKGVAAAMAALLGARGGTAIPDGDRKAVYNHLAKHYAQFEKQPPEFKTYTEEEMKTLFPEEIKSGRVLSSKNEGKIKQSVGLLTEVLNEMDNGTDGEGDANKSQEGEIAKRFEKMEAQIKHLIGEVQAYRKENKKEPETTQIDMSKVPDILEKAIEKAVKKLVDSN